MKIKPMLGAFAIDGIEYIESSESRALVEHRVPGLAGNYFQDMGTVPNTIVIAGTKTGDEARDDFLTGVREIFNKGEQTTFVADINTATDITDVIIEDLEVAEIGSSADSFRYLIKLRKYIKPPDPPQTSLLDAGIFDDALKLVDALNALDALSSISNLGDPTGPVRGALNAIKSTTEGLDQTVKDLGNLFAGEARKSAPPAPGTTTTGASPGATPTGGSPGTTEAGTPAPPAPAATGANIDPADTRFDAAAGAALQSMLDTPESAESARLLVGAVQNGALAGVAGDDSDVARQLAAAHGTPLSQLIPPGQDAALVLDAASPLTAPPTVILRNGVQDDPARLSAALEEVRQTFDIFERGELAPCEGAASPVLVLNLVPPTFCQVAPAKAGPREKAVITRGLFGMFFETDKTFLLPSAMRSIRLLNLFFEENPGGEILVVGHTDTVGPQDYNLELSKRRAQNMAAYLTDTVETWTACYQPQPISETWGTREDQHMLSVLPEGGEPFYTGPVDGIAGPKTEKAVSDFQEFSNANRGTTLTVDGVAGPKTRHELVKAYMGLDGTSLPEGTPLFSQGCGEFHPEVPTGDEVEEARNRRVEVFLFPEKIDPPMPPGGCKAPGCVEYPQWRERAGRTIDFTKEVFFGGGFPPCIFSSNRTFPKPSALPFLREVAKRAAADGGVQVLVLGHTDAAGSDAVNAAVSLARARAVAALLTGDEVFLRARFSEPDPVVAWDWEEAQFMLSALALGDDLFYAGVIDGDPGPLTANAVTRFQTFHDLEVTGELDGPTLDRLVHEYALLVGPERPAAAQLIVHGGGSWHPPRSLGEESRPLPPDELPNEAHPGPRRVEVFLAPGGLDPPLSSCPATRHEACAAHAAWCKKVREPIAITRNFLMPIRLVDANRAQIARQPVELFEHTEEADEKIAALTTNSAGLIFLQAPPGLYSVRTRFGGETFVVPFPAHADQVGGMTIRLPVEVFPDDRLLN
jgi:outer membrane protein OmpA-like peptidoglycan-associated protein/peptidoglycan hydrolase-like protein with peptidoglycan-binding domain